MSPYAILVAGLGFGDEGKGSVVDFLTRRHRADLVVRYNGGAQAAHNVVTDDGQHHCFAQFGSGTLAGAKTFLSRYMLVNPVFMLSEAKHLNTLGVLYPLARISVDAQALITTPYHVSANRLRELARGNARHGSCGMGIGETVEYAEKYPDEALRVGDIANYSRTLEKLSAIRTRLTPKAPCETSIDTDIFSDVGVLRRCFFDYTAWSRQINVIRDGDTWLADRLHGGTTIFEGAQGVLLDENYGFHPHTTWSDCTFKNAVALLDKTGFSGAQQKLGVTRSYHTRHGAGPFPTERVGAPPYAGEHNGSGEWQGSFRVGHLDLPLLRYASSACGGLDALAVTCLDHEQDTVCVDYGDGFSSVGVTFKSRPCLRQCASKDVVNLAAEAVKAPIAILSHGPAAKNKLECSSQKGD